jgi:hypothetical protein
VGIVEVIGAIGGGAGISISSGGTLLGEGITISVAGATAGTALAVAGSAASGRSIVSFGSDMDKYYDAKTNRMNAEGGGTTGSGTEGAGNYRFPESNSDIKKVFEVNKEIFHKDIKPEILKQIKRDPMYKKDFARMGNNPDIGIDNIGNIIFKNVSTKEMLYTKLPFKDFLPF